MSEPSHGTASVNNDYCFSVVENESEGLKSVKLSKLPGLLESERSRAESLAEKNRENATLLQRQTHSYLSVSQCTWTQVSLGQWRADTTLSESALLNSLRIESADCDFCIVIFFFCTRWLRDEVFFKLFGCTDIIE